MTARAVFRLGRPRPDQAARFLRAQAGLPFSYAWVGATAGSAPSGFIVDRYRVKLGAGRECFGRAAGAIRRWEQFKLGWVEAYPAQAAIQPAAVVAVAASVLGVWFFNAAKVVYVIEEKRRYGFAYGTVETHMEQGEERFLVEWLADDTVWYDVVAFSRPGHWMSRLGYPLVRFLQKRFGRDSQAAMRRAVTL